MKKKALSLLLALCMLLSLLPTTALATNTGTSSDVPNKYYRYALMKDTLVSSGIDYPCSTENKSGFSASQLGTENTFNGTTDSNGMLSSQYLYSETVYCLVGIKASNGKEYAVDAALPVADFSVYAYYSSTEAGSIPTGDISSDDTWYVVKLSGGYTLSPNKMPADGKVTVTAGGKTAEVTLAEAEPQPEAINTVTLSVTAPVAGNAPATLTAPGHTSIVSDTEKWTCSDTAVTTFTAGNTYQYEVVLKADDGYAFADPLDVTISGADEVDVKLGDTLTGSSLSDGGNTLKYAKVTAIFTVADAANAEDTEEKPATAKPFNSTVNNAANNLNAYASSNDRTLDSGVYFMQGNYTFSGTAANRNGLTIAEGATVYIYLNGYTLTAKGKAGTNTVPGGAGIALPAGAKLYFVGEGTVNANGGKGGKGFSGSRGGGSTANVTDDWPSTNWNYNFNYGTGGAGGDGGYGAGAGIGTGGSTNGTALASIIGTVTLVQDYKDAITLNAVGGAAGARGSNGAGGKGGHDWEMGWFSNGYASVEGAGGGGGGAGGSAGANIGIGGIQGVSGDKGTNANSTSSGTSSDNYTAKNNTHAATGTNGADKVTQSAAGADKSGDAKVVYTLQGITAESKFNALYDDAVNGEAIKAALTDPDNLNVYAYFYKDNAQNYFSEDARNAALNGTHSDNGRYLPTNESGNWIVWQLDENRYDASATIDRSTAAKAVLTVAYAPISAKVTSSDRENWILKVANDDAADEKEAPTNVNQTIEIPLLSNQAKDRNGIGNVIAGGDAIKFNDTSKFALAATNVYFAAGERQVYGNLDYNLKNASGEELNDAKTNVFSFIKNSGNKYYTVNYKPYNAYIDEDDAANGHYGTMTANDQYVLGAADDFKTYNDLKGFNFRNAGLYTITERVTRKANWGVKGAEVTGDTMSKTFDDIRYYVIEQADLEIAQAADVVYTYTKVQNHMFTNLVAGQNGEQVQGTFTFAARNSDGWGNGENRKVNASIPMQTGIEWEFNVYEGNYVYSSTIDGHKNLNNYLCQNDGTSAVTQALSATTGDVQNTYYQGDNGVLSYSASDGVAVVPAAGMSVMVTTAPDLNEDNKNNPAPVKNALNRGTNNGDGGVYWHTFTSESVPVDATKYPGPVYGNNGNNVMKSTYAEDVGIEAKVSGANLGWHVKSNDAINGSGESGTKITAAPVVSGLESYDATTAATCLISGNTYAGDLYQIVVKAGDQVVKNVYNKVENTSWGSISRLTQETCADLPACEYYNVSQYDVYVNYVGLYYTDQTTPDGRNAGWNGEEEFQWVVSGVKFQLDVDQRPLTIRDTEDFNKIYDGTAYLVKQTATGGKVTAASRYIIDVAAANNSNSQFAKEPGTALYNYLDPTGGENDHMAIELFGTYADKNKGEDKNVTISNARLLHFQNIPGKNTEIPVAGDQVCALNYKIVDNDETVENGLVTVTGDVSVAKMHFTHATTGSGKVYDFTPLHQMFNIHAEASQLTAWQKDANGEFFTSLTVTTDQELVERDDEKGTMTFTTAGTGFDYELTYAINNAAAAYAPYLTDTDFAIDESTGKVTTAAQTTMGEAVVAQMPAITVTVKNFPNFTLVAYDGSQTAPYNKCEKLTNASTVIGESWKHDIRFKITGNDNNYDLLLPVDQLNDRAVTDPATAYTPSKFLNRTGGTVATAAENGEKYDYVAVYPNGDSVQFKFTIPQNSYLEDVKIVKLPDYKTFKSDVATYGENTVFAPTFATLLADTTNVVGTFNSQATGMNNIANPLTLTLDEVNGTAVESAAYFGGSKADTATGYSATTLADANEQIGGSTYTFTLTTGACNLGQNYAIAVVPVIKPYSPILEKTPYTSNVSVEKKVTSTSDSTLTYTGAKDDFIYVNYKTLWDTTAGVSGQHGTVNMSYTDNGTTVSLTEQILAANYKDQFNSFGINTENYTSFFNPATLIPGTKVSVTLKVWRNGVTENLQNGTSDNDAMDEVTFTTWTVTPEDYYRLFKDDVVVFRSSNLMEANTELATEQKLTNIYGYGITDAPASMDFTAVTFVSNEASATKETKNILTTYADTWYKVDNSTGTRMTINASNNTMSGLALGNNLYPTYEYAKLVRDTVTNGNSVKTDLGYARVIFGQITLNNAFVYTNSTSIGVAPYSTSYTGAAKTAYTDTSNDLYWFDGWYKNDDGTALDGVAVNGTITDDGSTPIYTIKEHVNYVTFKDGSRVIGYGILDTSKDAKVSTMNFTAVPFTATKPVVGTANSTAKKNMTFTGTNPYTKSGYTLNGWYKNSVTEDNKVTDVASVTVAPANTFYLKSTPIGGGGAAVTTTTVTSTMPMLRKGNTGDAVKTLQTKLNALGYNCGAVDGVFGNDTYNAVVKYQKAMGISVDGVVGKESWGKLGVTGTTVTVAATTSVTSTTTTSATSNMPMLRKGNTGDAVKTLQTKLNALGYNCGAVDGVFGTNTYNAVVKYQKAMGISVDGVVGNQTWAKLG